jgi:hypothetical protein
MTKGVENDFLNKFFIRKYSLYRVKSGLWGIHVFLIVVN